MGPIPVEALPERGAGTVRVPLLGARLCAGFPSPADDFVEGALELPRWLVPNPPATFLMQVTGNSMRRAGIFDLDLAAIDRSLQASHDSIVVAVVDGLLSIKRYCLIGNVPHLAFDNEELPTFAVNEVADVEVWGVVRFSIRWHVARAGLKR